MYIHTPSSGIRTYTKIEHEQLREKPGIKTTINNKIINNTLIKTQFKQ